jgi:hypothetical protein
MPKVKRYWLHDISELTCVLLTIIATIYFLSYSIIKNPIHFSLLFIFVVCILSLLIIILFIKSEKFRKICNESNLTLVKNSSLFSNNINEIYNELNRLSHNNGLTKDLFENNLMIASQKAVRYLTESLKSISNDNIYSTIEYFLDNDRNQGRTYRELKTLCASKNTPYDLIIDKPSPISQNTEYYMITSKHPMFIHQAPPCLCLFTSDFSSFVAEYNKNCSGTDNYFKLSKRRIDSFCTRAIVPIRSWCGHYGDKNGFKLHKLYGFLTATAKSPESFRPYDKDLYIYILSYFASILFIIYEKINFYYYNHKQLKYFAPSHEFARISEHFNYKTKKLNRMTSIEFKEIIDEYFDNIWVPELLL